MKPICRFSLILLGGCILSASVVHGQTAPAITTPPKPATFVAGDLELSLQASPDGLKLTRLFDRGAQQELLATNSLPLFRLLLRQVATREETRLEADTGWQQAGWRKTKTGFALHWERPRNDKLVGISVSASAVADHSRSAWHWQMRVANTNQDWSVWRIVFPQIALTDLGEGAVALFPRGPGEAQSNVWRRSFSYQGEYPGGWCAMQFMAAYRQGDQPTGLYLALHDPWGSTKNLALESDPARRSLQMRFDHPAVDMGKGANAFELSGDAVWQVLRGDWFDAAMIYKKWVRRDARWWPRLTAEGRADTPLWMRGLNAWAMTGGAPGECVPRVQQFQKFLGLPVGFHWYNWHQIPFDNDYPHYFPAKEGFAPAVADLQQSQVWVMPYINGRLWDSHDRGAEDFEFSRLALAATTKDLDGKPYLETYGSKETNGQPVRLAAMCPATGLWQQTVSNIVLRLLKENGTRAVYIDQVAAAAPKLCLDRSHGHPLGGGHWWNEGYWQMLEAIRRAMPREAMLTTECNGEPFVRWFDGYLTWHWQHDGQVPVFPAVYGGAVQMFGRAYRGGASKDLALRMKAGQQLVFGEQLGWIDPGVINEPANAEFFRQLVQMRARLNRYFYAGEMARPPRLTGNLPRVKADWQWSGEWWVTTEAVLAGAWKIPAERRLALLFVNVSDAPVETELRFEAGAYGLAARQLTARKISASGQAGVIEKWPRACQQPLVLAPRQAQSWELGW